MGIKGFWELISHLGRRVNLRDLALHHRQTAQQNGRQDDTLTLGVDMGPMMVACTAGANSLNAFRFPAGGGLYVFFKRLMEYLEGLLILVFVFDGPGRPGMKRRHQVQYDSIEWEAEAMQLIEILGWQVRQAPGEAEAELARLNREGMIHGVITTDSDALIFGATHVLRPVSSDGRTNFDEHDLFHAADLFDPTHGLSLSPGGLVLIALLCGGDYNPGGVQSCGPATALEIAHCAFGDQLLRAFRELSDADFARFLVDWRRQLRAELTSNNSGHLTRCHPAISRNIPTDFGSRDVLLLYATPLTTWSIGCETPSLRTISVLPNIFQLAQFCQRYFKWSMDRTLLRFNQLVWEGVFLQLLFSPLMVFDQLSRRFVGPDRQSRIISSSLRVRKGDGPKARFGNTEQVKLKISTDDFISSMGGGFLERASPGNTLTIWPPRKMLPPGVLIPPRRRALKKGVNGMGKGKEKEKGQVRDLRKPKKNIEPSRTRIKGKAKSKSNTDTDLDLCEILDEALKSGQLERFPSPAITDGLNTLVDQAYESGQLEDIPEETRDLLASRPSPPHAEVSHSLFGNPMGEGTSSQQYEGHNFVQDTMSSTRGPAMSESLPLAEISSGEDAAAQRYHRLNRADTTKPSVSRLVATESEPQYFIFTDPDGILVFIEYKSTGGGDIIDLTGED